MVQVWLKTSGSDRFCMSNMYGLSCSCLFLSFPFCSCDVTRVKVSLIKEGSGNKDMQCLVAADVMTYNMLLSIPPFLFRMMYWEKEQLGVSCDVFKSQYCKETTQKLRIYI